MRTRYSTGALPSPKDIRTFGFAAPAAAAAPAKGGQRYSPADIEDQAKVGICTAISLTQNARKATGVRYSADFQYLIQKIYYDRNWSEGSSIFHALKAAKEVGLLPEAEFSKWITETDRKLSYEQYVAKLKAVPAHEIERLREIASKHKIVGYASVKTDRDSLAKAILESKAGILTRYEVGAEWWTPPVEPLRRSAAVISGHATSDTNFDGQSFRLANTWGADWADRGTGYRLQTSYVPTEAWIPYYASTPEIEQQLESRESIIGQILDLIQKIVALINKLR